MPEARFTRPLRRLQPSWRHRDGDSVLARRLDHRLDRIASGRIAPADGADRSVGDDSELGQLTDTVADVFALDSRSAPVSSPRAQTDKAAIWNSVVRNVDPAETTVTYRPARRREPAAAPVSFRGRRFAPVLGVCLAALLLLAVLSPLRHAGWDLVFPPQRSVAVPTPAPLPEIPALSMDNAAQSTGCDLASDIPIFQGVDTSPVNRTALLVRTDGELVLTCPEASTPRALASDVLTAESTNWPGVVRTRQVYDGSQPDSGALIDLPTGKSVDVSSDLPSISEEIHRNGPSPWVVARASGDSRDWMIVDLRTMESRPLSDYGSGSLVDHIGMDTASNGAAGTIVIDVSGRPNDALSDAEQPLPGDALVIEDSFDAFHWLSFPDDIRSDRRMMLAPDGNHLTVTASGADDSVSYHIIDIRHGDETARSPSFTDPEPSMLWVNDGDAIVYIRDATVTRLAVEPGSEPERLSSDWQAIGRLRLAHDPAVVIVERIVAILSSRSVINLRHKRPSHRLTHCGLCTRRSSADPWLRRQYIGKDSGAGM